MSEQTKASAGYTPKKLIVCCDGTWRNSASGIFQGTGLSWIWRGEEQISTNVTRISQAIKTTDSRGRQQIVFYQAGVGSEGNLIERMIGGALGVGLAANIRAAYSFLANNYVSGDEIFLIGFSRGAFTARSIGGVIGDFGLLTTDGQENLVDILEDWEHAGSDGYKTLLGKDSPEFTVKTGVADPKLGLTRKEVIPIKAIAVWETVGSLGIPVNPFFRRLGFPLVLRKYRFYNTDLGANVENAFQALALDEARSAYRPAIWQKPPGVTANLKQTWLPGVHSNIGGGLPDTGLSDITLAWMMSNLAPFLDFTPNFVVKQHEKNQQFLIKAKVPESGFKWAANLLKSTSTGIRALLGIAWRHPGRYHVLDKKKLVVNKDKPLQNTNEHIHVAVRSRELTGGLDGKDRMSEYKPKAFKRDEYELLNPGAEPGKASWRYVGNEAPFTGEVLPEDELGIFEREIFQNYVSHASA